MKTCGNCTLCCKVMAVREISKPENKWCTHCDRSQGCKIYADRPTSCAEFACLWLQDPSAFMGPELRPDRCKVVFLPYANGAGVECRVDPDRPDAWLAPHVFRVLQNVANAGYPALVRVKGEMYCVGKKGVWQATPEYLIDQGDGKFELRIPDEVIRKLEIAREQRA